MKTEFTIAYRCGDCGKIQFHHISLFHMSGKKSLQFTCSCGHKGVSMATKDYKKYRLSVHCVVCGLPHIYPISLREILLGKPITLSCMRSSLELCFIGEKEKVEKVVDIYQQDLEELIDELGYDDYFVNGEIMMESLDLLHDLAEEGDIECECGSMDMDLNLLSDKIQLKCKECGSTIAFPAKSREDVEGLRKRHYIFIKKNNLPLWETLPMDPK